MIMQAVYYQVGNLPAVDREPRVVRTEVNSLTLRYQKMQKKLVHRDRGSNLIHFLLKHTGLSH